MRCIFVRAQKPAADAAAGDTEAAAVAALGAWVAARCGARRAAPAQPQHAGSEEDEGEGEAAEFF
jgi:hypothetical protein